MADSALQAQNLEVIDERDAIVAIEAYRHAVDEARARTVEEGIQDARPEVLAHWRDAGTWRRSPVLVTGEVIGTSLDAQCRVGFTRLGNLLGLLDRREVPEAARHRVWLGRKPR
jgi:hypothetical protein